MQVNKDIAIPAGVGVVSLSVGFAAGYFFHKKRMEKEVREYIEEVEAEFDDSQLQLNWDQVEDILDNGEPIGLSMNGRQDIHLVDPDRFVRDPEEEIVTDVVIEETDEEVVISFEDRSEPVPVSIFTQEDDDWDYNEEVTKRERQPDKPYVIHVDEFFGEQFDHRQTQLMYYAGDDVLCDENNVPIYNVKDIVGDAIRKFGHGSKDENIVFVRNVGLDCEYEITRDPGHYTVEVLGAEIEEAYEAGDLRHAHIPHKFRE